MPTERWVDYLRDHFRTMQYVPIAFITGQTGKNMKALLNHTQMLFKQARQRVSTGELNRLVQPRHRVPCSTVAQEPAAQNLLRDTGRHTASHDHHDVQHAAGIRCSTIGGTCSASCVIS